MVKEELLKGLTEEQLAKARACKSISELLEAAEKEGIQLTEEQLKSVTGGTCGQPRRPTQLECPNCGVVTSTYEDWDISDTTTTCHCNVCGFVWHSPLK